MHKCRSLQQQRLKLSFSGTSPDWVPVVFSSDCDEDEIDSVMVGRKVEL